MQWILHSLYIFPLVSGAFTTSRRALLATGVRTFRSSLRQTPVGPPFHLPLFGVPACDARVYVCENVPLKIPNADEHTFRAMLAKREQRVALARHAYVPKTLPLRHPATDRALAGSAEEMFRILPNYFVGEGGMCSVWLGVTPDQSVVAVRDAIVPDQRLFSLTLYEILIASTITSHSNLVRFHGAAFDEPKTSVMMAYEYVSLDTTRVPDLAALAGGHGRATVSMLELFQWGYYSDEGRIADMARQVLSALDHLHNDVRAVHRDVKPENVFVGHPQAGSLVSDYPHGLCYKLGDLGIALPLDAAGRGIPLPDGTYDASGTAAFMAPETRGVGIRSGPAADVWALGRMAMLMVPGEVDHLDILPGEVWARAGMLSGRVSTAFLHFLYVALSLDPTERMDTRTLRSHPFVANAAVDTDTRITMDTD